MSEIPTELVVPVPMLTNPEDIWCLVAGFAYLWAEGAGGQPPFASAFIRSLGKSLIRLADDVSSAHDLAVEAWRDEIINLLGPDD